MALGIVVLLIGIPIGLLMLFKPRDVWRATEGWKFRNPEANEPSGTAYALGGLGMIGGTLLLAMLAFTKPDSSSTASKTSTYPRYPTLTFSPPPPSPFVPPAVVTRGALNMIGYLTTPGPDGGLIATVYFWAPEVASKVPAGNPPPPAPCELAPNVQGAGTDHVTVDVELSWSPTTTSGLAFNSDCNAGGDRHQVRRSYVVGPVSATAKLFTSRPEADTPLPRLAEAPGPLGDPAPSDPPG